MSQAQTPQPDAAPGDQGRKDSAGRWSIRKDSVLPVHVRVLALSVIAAIMWCAAEAFWPSREPNGLDFAIDSSDYSAVSPGDSADGVTLRDSLFASRKLFIPEVPVESKDTSRAVFDQMLSRLKVTSIMEQGDQLIAYIVVSDAPAQTGSTYSSARTAPSGRTQRVRKGDHVLDFEVADVTADSVKLTLAGFDGTLTF